MFRLPLTGFRVLDLSTGRAGPYAARLLADMGAEVIKAESPGRPDPLRSRTEEQGRNKAPLFDHVNRNKYGLSLDLAKPQGRELLLRLVSLSDVVIESFRPGEMEELGLALDALQGARQDVILVSVAGQGEPGGDPMAGVAAAGAIALALWHHRHTGRGQRIEVDRRENLIGLIGEHVLGSSMTGQEALRSAEVPAAPLLDTPEVFAESHLRARGFFEPVAHAEGGVGEMEGVPWRFSESPAHVRLPAPCLGEHNGYVLRGLLGLSDGEVAALARDGVTGEAPGQPAEG
jgi:formyl-CoA transferase